MQDQRQDEHIDPEGSQEPLSPIESTLLLAYDVFLQSLDVWNATMEIYNGMLQAEVITIFDDALLLPIFTPNVTAAWRWYEQTKNYRNPKRGITVGQMRQVTLRDNFTDLRKARLQSLHTRLVNGDITIQQWTRTMRKAVRDQYAAQFMLGRGGINAVTEQDLSELTDVVREQHQHLQRFADEIRTGQLSEAQIRNRAGQYIESSTQARDRGKAASFDVILPAYPGDGSQICRANCRCHWEINQTEFQVRAFWRLEATAEHCDTCLRNAADWSPYIIQRR